MQYSRHSGKLHFIRISIPRSSLKTVPCNFAMSLLRFLSLVNWHWQILHAKLVFLFALSMIQRPCFPNICLLRLSRQEKLALQNEHTEMFLLSSFFLTLPIFSNSFPYDIYIYMYIYIYICIYIYIYIYYMYIYIYIYYMYIYIHCEVMKTVHIYKS